MLIFSTNEKGSVLALSMGSEPGHKGKMPQTIPVQASEQALCTYQATTYAANTPFFAPLSLSLTEKPSFIKDGKEKRRDKGEREK